MTPYWTPDRGRAVRASRISDPAWRRLGAPAD